MVLVVNTSLVVPTSQGSDPGVDLRAQLKGQTTAITNWDERLENVKQHYQEVCDALTAKEKRFSKYEPFALAQQAQHVYFAEWASKKRDRNDWWVVCKIQARSMINVPEVAYQEDEICEQYETSIDDEDVNLCGDVGMARGKGRGTIARVGRGGRTAVQNDGGSACSRLRKGRSLSQSGGSFNDEIEETPIEVPMQDGDGGNHVEEYVHQPTSNDHSNNGVPSCTETQQTDTTQIPQSNTTQTQQTKTKQLRKSPDGRIYIEPYHNSFV
ncbi:pheromone-processing carboxypeptidase KEX1-like [Senna tora]|uniref:Pheromone-processing carboxypeptidase KEX1-like n=1 Tax=Senna tora TaxID=362788 RepID=A0A834X7K3_9FABA|nr:pheromone-processing carboxypeptidase KEX1-like [Senna tora]